MEKPFPWIDAILNIYSYEIKLNRKGSQKAVVEFNRIADDEADKGTNALAQKNRIRLQESEKLERLLKAIFGEHIAPDCIKQLTKIGFLDLNDEPLTEEDVPYDLPEYDTQCNRFYVICQEYIHQIITKSVSMGSETVEEIKNLSSKIVNSKTYFEFSQPVKAVIDKHYEYVLSRYYRYLWYVNAIIVSQDPKYKAENIDYEMKVGICEQLRSSLDRNEFKHVFPEINWEALPEELPPDSENLLLIVESVYNMLKREADEIINNELSTENIDILHEKIIALREFHAEKFNERLNKDEDFKSFIELIEKASKKLNESLRVANDNDFDVCIQETQRATPNDFISIQEMTFLAKLYALIYKKYIPEGKFEWHDVDAVITEKICTYVNDYSKYRSIYRYIEADYSTLWDTIDDVKNRVKCPTVRYICRMIDRMNLGMSMYCDIYRKLIDENPGSDDAKKAMLDFEKSLKDAYKCFESKLGKAYDSVLNDSTPEYDLEKLSNNIELEREAETE